VRLVQCTLEGTAVDCRLQSPAKTSCAVPVLLDPFALSKLDLMLLMVSDMDLYNNCEHCIFLSPGTLLDALHLVFFCSACGAERYR
jgi:hypothetical protein